MDGLMLVLALVVWFVSKTSKKNKKSKGKPVFAMNAENAASRRADRTAQLHAELEKRRAQLKMEKPASMPPAPGEGEPMISALQAEQAFRGSMQIDSTEGECICDPALEHAGEQTLVPESVYAGEIGREPLVDISARGMMQGIIMSEILTRPAQRARRR